MRDLSMVELNERVARLESRHEGLDTYLPALLARFEHMEQQSEQRALRE